MGQGNTSQEEFPSKRGYDQGMRGKQNKKSCGRKDSENSMSSPPTQNTYSEQGLFTFLALSKDPSGLWSCRHKPTPLKPELHHSHGAALPHCVHFPLQSTVA